MKIDETARINHLVKTLGIDGAKNKAIEMCTIYEETIQRNRDGRMYFDSYREIMRQLRDFINKGDADGI